MRIQTGFHFVTEVPEGYDYLTFTGKEGDLIAASPDKLPLYYRAKDNKWFELTATGSKLGKELKSEPA